MLAASKPIEKPPMPEKISRTIKEIPAASSGVF
jgi:hypothetical protein